MRYPKRFSRFVSTAPKKVIAIIVVFTVIMGLFATGVEMDTEEEHFEPDRPKQDYLSTVQETFGAEEEMVQVAFTADGGDVFSEEVMRDMLDFEENLTDDQTVNQTLASTADVPTGVNTLASNVLMVDQSLLLEDFVIQQADQTYEMVESQEKMFERMNASLSLNMGLMGVFGEEDPIGLIGVNQTLISMSDIVSNPDSWMVMGEYEEEFNELIEKLPPESDSGVSDENLSAYIDGWLDDMRGVEDPELDNFLELVEGTGFILDHMLEAEQYSNDTYMPRTMLLSFFGVAEPMGALEEPDFSALEDPPKLQLSMDEKRERLDNMTTDDLKETVEDILDYDPSELNESVSRGMNLTDKTENAIAHLTNMENLLNQAIERYEEYDEINMTWEAQQLRDGYLASVSQNRTLLNESKPMYEEAEVMFGEALRLGPMMEQMGTMITSMADKDFDPEAIQAESCLGIVFMDPEAEGDEKLEAQKKIIEIGDDLPEHSEVRVSASRVMMEEINDSADKTLDRLLPIAFILVVIILFIVFRSIVETVLSLGTLGIAIVWTFGFGVIMGYTFNPMIIAVPVLITGLVIDYGMHMVLRYKEEKRRDNSPRKSTSITILAVGGALVLTTFTTAIGFLSNRISDIGAMQQFGTLAAMGIVSSLVLMMTFLPAMVQIYDEWKDKRKNNKKKSKKKLSKKNKDKSKNNAKKTLARKAKEHGGDIIGGILSKSADASDRHPWVVLVVVLLITGVAASAAVNVDTTFDIEDFLPEDQPQSKNMKYLAERFEVEDSYAYILTDEGDLDSSRYLYAVSNTTENIEDSEMVGGDGGDVRSPLSVLRTYGTASPGSLDYNETITRAFHQSDINGDGIPNRNVTELYNMLFEYDQSRDAISNVLHRTEEGDGDYTYELAVIRLLEDGEKISSDLDNAAVLEEELEEDVEPLRDAEYPAKITSGSMLAQETTSELTDTQIQTLIATIIIVAVTLTMVFYFKDNVRMVGVITTIPVALTTLWILGTMYLFDIPLNVMTVTVTALTVGMGVDYSIHISYRFMEERSYSQSLHEAMEMTVRNTGGAIFGSAMTTVAAFGVLSTSEIPPIAQFGGITALALFYSFVAAVFVLPAFLMIWAKSGQRDD
ncbi:MAG: efflux RND transporter permease subunit [Candidatus Thermoplasmatota archaeon]